MFAPVPSLRVDANDVHPIAIPCIQESRSGKWLPDDQAEVVLVFSPNSTEHLLPIWAWKDVLHAPEPLSTLAADRHDIRGRQQVVHLW